MKQIHEMSDAELEAIAAGSDDISSMSEEELQQIAGPQTAEIQQKQPTSKDIGSLLGQSALGLGLGDEAAGIGASLGYLAGGGSFSEIKQIYEEAKDAELQAAKKTEQDFPSLSTGIEIGSAIATAPLNPIAAGAITGAGLSEGANRVSGAAIGGALGKAGQKLGDFVAKAGPVLEKQAKTLQLNNMLEGMGAQAQNTKNKIISLLQRKGLDPYKFMDDLTKTPVEDGVLYSVGQSAEETLEKSKVLKQQLNNAINELTHDVDMAAGGSANINPAELQLKMEPIISKYLSSSSEIQQEAARTLMKRLEFMSNKTSLSLRDLHRFVRDTAGDINWKNPDATIKNEALSDMFHVGKEFLADSIEFTSSDPILKNLFQDLNKKYSNVAMFDELISKQSSGEITKAANIASFGDALKNALNLNFGSAAQEIIQASGISDAAKNASLKIVAAAQQDAPRYAKYASRIVQAASRSPEAFERALAVSESAIDLAQAPLQRTFQDVELKKSQIFNLLQDDDAPLAAQFLDAVNNKESEKVGALLSDLSRIPKYKEIITPGIGWDGKVTNDVEKGIVKQQIKEASIPTIEKMRQTEALEKSGTIPIPKQESPVRQLILKQNRKNGRKIEQY
jgi:hypothetical protein